MYLLGVDALAKSQFKIVIIGETRNGVVVSKNRCGVNRCGDQ